MTFSDNLKKYRLLAGFKSAKEFADSIGIKYTTYMSYENKGTKPPLTILDISVDELIGIENTEDKQD